MLQKPPKPHSSDPYEWQLRPKEIEKLKVDLESLPIDKVERVAKILQSQQNLPIGLKENDEIVIELVGLHNDVLWELRGGGERTSYVNVRTLTFLFLSFEELDHFITNYKKNQGKKTDLKRVYTLLVMNTNGVHVNNTQIS